MNREQDEKHDDEGFSEAQLLLVEDTFSLVVFSFIQVFGNSGSSKTGVDVSCVTLDNLILLSQKSLRVSVHIIDNFFNCKILLKVDDIDHSPPLVYLYDVDQQT